MVDGYKDHGLFGHGRNRLKQKAGPEASWRKRSSWREPLPVSYSGGCRPLAASTSGTDVTFSL